MKAFKAVKKLAEAFVKKNGGKVETSQYSNSVTVIMDDDISLFFNEENGTTSVHVKSFNYSFLKMNIDPRAKNDVNVSKLEALLDVYAGCVEKTKAVIESTRLPSGLSLHSYDRKTLPVIHLLWDSNNRKNIVLFITIRFVGDELGEAMWFVRNYETNEVKWIDIDDLDGLTETIMDVVRGKTQQLDEARTRNKMSAKKIADELAKEIGGEAFHGVDTVVIIPRGLKITIRTSADNFGESELTFPASGRLQPLSIWFDIDDIDRVVTRLVSFIEIWNVLRSQVDAKLEETLAQAGPLVVHREGWLGFATKSRPDWELVGVFPMLKEQRLDGEIMWKSHKETGGLASFETFDEAYQHMMTVLPIVKERYPAIREEEELLEAKTSAESLANSVAKNYQGAHKKGKRLVTIPGGLLLKFSDITKRGNDMIELVVSMDPFSSEYSGTKWLPVNIDIMSLDRARQVVESAVEIWHDLNAMTDIVRPELESFLKKNELSLMDVGWLRCKYAFSIAPVLVGSRIDGGVEWTVEEDAYASEEPMARCDSVEEAIEIAKALTVKYLGKIGKQPIMEAELNEERIDEGWAWVDKIRSWKHMTRERMHSQLMSDYRKLTRKERGVVREITKHHDDESRNVEIKKYADIVDEMLESMQAQRDFIVFRGTGGRRVGSPMMLQNVTSWSLDPMMCPQGAGVIALAIEKGSRLGAYVAAASTYPMQMEFMLQPINLNLHNKPIEIKLFGEKTVKAWFAVWAGGNLSLEDHVRSADELKESFVDTVKGAVKSLLPAPKPIDPTPKSTKYYIKLHDDLSENYKFSGRNARAIRDITSEDNQDNRDEMLVKHAEAFKELTTQIAANREFFIYRSCKDMTSTRHATYADVRSWSIDPGQALTFNIEGNDIMAMHIKPGSRDGAYVANYSSFRMEMEFITRPGLSISISPEPIEYSDKRGTKMKMWIVEPANAAITAPVMPLNEADLKMSRMEDIAKYAAQELGCAVETIREWGDVIVATFIMDNDKVSVQMRPTGELTIGLRTMHPVTQTTLGDRRHPVDGGVIVANLVKEAMDFAQICREASDIADGSSKDGISYDGHNEFLEHVHGGGGGRKSIARVVSKSFVREIRPVGAGPERRVVETAQDVADFLIEILNPQEEIQEAAANMESSVKLLLAPTDVTWINPSEEEDFEEIEYQLQGMPRGPMRDAYTILSIPQEYQRAVKSGRSMAITSANVGAIANTDAADPSAYESLDPTKRSRVESQFELGSVTKPILLSTPFGLRLIAGNTRATLAMKKFGRFEAWVISL